MSRIKTWMITGCTLAVTAALLFIGLALTVFLTNPDPSPRFTVLCLLDMLLGITAVCLIIGGKMCHWLEESGQARWWKGYSAAVEDLKDADVLQFPAPADRADRRG